jgi:hypothetical protein
LSAEVWAFSGSVLTFGNQATGTVNTSGMELHKLQILQRQTSTGDHGIAITRASVCGRAREVGPSVTTSRENGLVGTETVKGSVLHVEGNDTDTLAVLHNQVQGEVFDKVLRVMSQGLAVECVENGVAGTVGSGGASVSLATLAELERLSTKGTLVDLAFLRSGEGYTVVLELSHG